MDQQDHQIKMKAEGLNFYYGAFQALKNVHLEVKERQITALIGPSGCGKSTFLRALNRMNELIPGSRVAGSVRLSGRDIYARDVDVSEVRRRVGMVFQRSNPFPMTIFKNVAYGLAIAGGFGRGEVAERVERSL